jgi:hypothetical protein
VFPFFGLFVLFFDATFGARWLRRASRRVARALVERHRRAVAYRDLRSLDEYMLRDIGLSHRAASEWWNQRRDTP